MCAPSKYSCLIAVRSDHTDDCVEYEGTDYYYGLGWFTYSGNPWRVPRSIFDVLIRTVKVGDRCPTCREGRLYEYDMEKNLSWLCCDTCGDIDNDDWWRTLTVRIRWQGP